MHSWKNWARSPADARTEEVQMRKISHRHAAGWKCMLGRSASPDQPPPAWNEQTSC